MKGMVNGEPIKTGVVSKEYEAGHERTFGEPVDFPRGRRFRWDPTLKKLVPAGFVEEKQAVHANVLAGRFYENTQATDGTDIGSRRKRREYMRANSLADADDYKGEWAKKAEARAAVSRGEFDRKARREALEKAWYTKVQNRRG